MEVNDQSLASLRDLLLQVMSPDNAVRKNAETYVNDIQKVVGFPNLLFHLISRLCGSTVPQDISIRQSAAVLFKNLVKKRWILDDNSEDQVIISDVDKDLIKTHLVELMCSAPVDVQKQLAEAVTLVAKHDFPEKWQNLLPHLVSKLATCGDDIQMSKGVMLTANSIMKRFRYAFSSDDLFSEILLCLKDFQGPLTEKYVQNNMLIGKFAGSEPELAMLFETQRLMTRIYFSLNWQDIPEFFEDNIQVWMQEFSKYLVYTNPLLVDDSEEIEAGPVEKLQAAILENLNLYATKYEDIFEPFLPNFTHLVWELLIKVDAKPKYDLLATSAIKFLTSVSSKQMNVGLFTEPVLRDIVEHIVVKNLTATEGDEELFEDNPTDYIRKDMEGSDQDTRRRAACELVRSLLKFFGPQVTQLCITYIGAMLEQYAKSRDWRAKDAALHLVLAVAVKSSSSTSGANELNPEVDIMSLFDSQVLPEVHDEDVNSRPIVKADAIKMICIFRSHLPLPFLLALLPHIIRHLHSSHVVIQTYAAMCIERFLNLKDKDPATGVNVPRITKEHLQPFFQSLFQGLFTVLENTDLSENDYVMKCIMRMLVVAGSAVGPVTEMVIASLTKALERVCRNAINPHYNHYLFECLAVLIKSTCNSSNLAPEHVVGACDKFESLLFPPFQAILANDVEEFVPYAFQILAQLLASRPSEGLSAPYLSLFPPLLSPALWERKGNVPALTSLFRAYVSKGMAEITAGGHLTGVLGVFQKLLASKSTEVHAFELLNALYMSNPLEAMQPFLPTIFGLLLHRMQDSAKESKTTRYSRSFLHSMCVFSAVYSAQSLWDTLEGVSKGLISMIVLKIWEPNRDGCAALAPLEVKHMVVGGTKLLLECPVCQSPDVFAYLLKSIVTLLDTSKTGKGMSAAAEDFLLEGDESKEFDSAYSKLVYASVPSVDPIEQQAPSTHAFFAHKLSAFCAAHAGQYLSVIQNGLDSREAELLQGVLQQHNARLS